MIRTKDAIRELWGLAGEVRESWHVLTFSEKLEVIAMVPFIACAALGLYGVNSVVSIGRWLRRKR